MVFRRSISILALTVLLAACSQDASSGTFTLDAPLQWGKNAALIGSGTGAIVVEINSGLSIEGPFPQGHCDFDRRETKWVCSGVSVSSDYGNFIGRISSLEGVTPDERIDQVRSAGYYSPSELTGAYVGFVNGVAMPVRVFVWGEADGNAVINMFVGSVDVQTYVHTVEDIPNVLATFNVRMATQEDHRSFDSFTQDVATRSALEGDVVDLGTARFSLPAGYVAGEFEVWNDGIYAPNGVCMDPVTEEPANVDARVVIAERKDNQFDAVQFSTPSLCISLRDAAHYCFQREQKTLQLGGAPLTVTYLHNDFESADASRELPDGSWPCKPYENSAATYVEARGCRADGVCVWSPLPREAFEEFVRGVRQL
jgi:hypothetical protein